MQYKQFLLSAAISLAAITTTQAQYGRNDQGDNDQKFYIKAGVQYAMPIMGTLGFKGTASPSTSVAGVDSSLGKASFGGGLWAGVNIGYFITTNFGIEAGVKMAVTNQEYSLTYESPYNEKSTTTTRTNHPVILNPSLVYRIPFDKFSIVGKGGLIIPFHTDLTQSVNKIYDNAIYPDDIVEYEYTVRNRFGLGLSCGIGAEYRFTEHIALSLDLSVMTLSIDSKEKELTSDKFNGVELIDGMTPEQKMTYYDYSFSPSATKQHTQPFPVSFSNASARIGIAIYF